MGLNPRISFVGCLFALCTSFVALAQVEQDTVSPKPYPYVFGGIALYNHGMGYHTYAATVGGGVRLESPRLIFNSEVWADNARKLDSHTGHNLGLRSIIGYRVPGSTLYLGGGSSFSELKTAPYVKRGWRPRVVADFDVPKSDRYFHLQADYVFPGQDKSNGVHGMEVRMFIPSMSRPGRWFFRETLSIYRFHDTITDPEDTALTARQRGHKSMGAVLDFTLIYRF